MSAAVKAAGRQREGNLQVSALPAAEVMGSEDVNVGNGPVLSETSVPSYTPGINRRSARTRRKLRNGLVEAAIMQPPEDRLMESEMRAKVYITNQEADLAIKELVRCTALARICYGDHHWKLARAHSNLAKEYFHLKGLPIQAIEQAEKAHGILLAYSQLPASDEEKREFLRCLIAHFHTMGRVLTAQQKYPFKAHRYFS
nr:PREDICTED: tetratricopeptide repeat protein 23-like [Latimeria chalumnae]|eukprot:XP_006007234.1 PREDICTED: tetratricopeptide repeat protein 23-like [Latimeria chalumnae]